MGQSIMIVIGHFETSRPQSRESAGARINQSRERESEQLVHRASMTCGLPCARRRGRRRSHGATS